MRLSWIDEQIDARKGMTRREVGEAAGLDEGQMSKVMGGTRKLSADEADAIRRFFGYRLPDDPDADVERALSRLSAHQRRAVALYLEALTGARPEPRSA